MAGLGIFDYLSNLNQQAMGGSLGATPPGAPTALRSVSDFLTNNPALVSNLAYSIGNAPSLRQGVINVGRGMPDAMNADKQTQEASQQKAALSQYLGNPDTAKALTPGQLQFLKALPPDVAAKYVGQQMFPGTTGNSSAYTDYLHAKGEGYPGKFTDWEEKYGSNRSAESWGLTSQNMEGPDGSITGAFRMSDRGGIQYLDKNANVIRTYHPGDPNYDAAASAAQSAGATPPTSATAGPTPAATPEAGTIRPPGSSKLVNQGTQTTPLSPGNKPGAPLPTYNTQESADKAAGTQQAADLNTVNNASIKATTQKNSIALMRKAAADPNFYSGAFADQVQAVKKLGVALGMDPNLAASMENFQSMSNQLVKDRLGSLGTGVSNADVSFISRTVPTLEATPQGNQRLLDILEQLANRDIEVAKVAQQYAKDHGGGTRLDANWPSYLADWAASHPLFSDAGGAGASGQPSVDDLIKKYAP